MIPIKTSVEDLQKLTSYLGRQVGWTDAAKAEKALGAIDDRKVAASVEFGLVSRDGANLRITDRGQRFNSDGAAALREVLLEVELYRATLEWVHYGKRATVTAAEVGQYWDSSHQDTTGGRQGSTLKDGAVTFGRVVQGAKVGGFTIGRGGKETRIAFDLGEVAVMVEGRPDSIEDDEPGPTGAAPEDVEDEADAQPVSAPSAIAPERPATRDVPIAPSVSVSTSPSVHVNIEIHIAADATADTVREIFKNMARYVLDKPLSGDEI